MTPSMIGPFGWAHSAIDLLVIASNTALVLLNDLMFRVKIEDALKRVGFVPRFMAAPQELLDVAGSGVGLIVVDLNFTAARPLELIRNLKADPVTRAIPLLSYVSHVQTDTRALARDAGCDQVIARSALIPALLAIRKHGALKGEQNTEQQAANPEKPLH